MSIRKVEFENNLYKASFSITIPDKKPQIRNEFVENPLLNVYCPKRGNPVIEDLMDKVIIARSIPLDDGEATLRAIKNKTPYLSEYIDDWIKALKKYHNMI